MNNSTRKEIEDAVSDLFSNISGINIYKSNRTGARLFPFITIQAFVNDQMLGNYTGVYNLSVSLKYSDTAVKTSKEEFDSKYCEIFDALYEETPTLANKIQNQILNTKVYMARITSQTPSIRTAKKAWERGLSLNIIATPSELSDGIRCYNFSDSLNSFYIASI